jgi:predicted Zn-dependent protease
MVIIKLKGGLGNQMFQYAAARQLSVLHNVELKLDLSFLEKDNTDYTKRYFELDNFKINSSIASVEEVARLNKKSLKNIISGKYVKELKLGPFSIKPHTKKDCYISGFWQSTTYFRNIEKLLKNEFEFKEPVYDSFFSDIKSKILDTNSVSLHFRRGDYVTNKRANFSHGVCSIEYYQKAVNYIAKRINNPTLFIFSDDIHWVKCNFKTTLPAIFVEQKNESLHTDFQLMSICKHNIIANSSYSWWAAWLNNNSTKIVVLPRIWFRNKWKQIFIAKDFIPKQWIKL